MGSGITLSAAARQNLLSLQDTASLLSTTQSRLSTGKKVNSALDNPVNFFTASNLTDRSNKLTGLLDGISNGIQTIQAANTGASKITDLMKTLQSSISQAQSEAAANRPTVTGTVVGAVTEAEAKATGNTMRTTVLNQVLGGAAAVRPSDTSAGNLAISGAGGKIAIQLETTKSSYTKYLDATSTVGDLVSAINASGMASASVDETGKLTVTGISDNLKVGIGGGTDNAAALTNAKIGGGNDELGLAAAAYTTGTTNTKASAARAALITQFNDLRDQIDQTARDSGFNGTNLLAGDALTVIFNEKTGTDQSKLTVNGNKLTAAGLGVSKAVNGTTTTAGEFNFQTDEGLASMQDSIKTAMASLKSMQSSFGSSLSVAQNRQDFTKQMSNILTTGASALTDADLNEEAANSQALSTRNSLAISALSLANQAQQGVLQLLR